MHIDPARDQFGVSVARPDADATPPTALQSAALDARADQICTLGFDADGHALIPAEDEQQIVAMGLRCAHYNRVLLNGGRIDWTNLF